MDKESLTILKWTQNRVEWQAKRTALNETDERIGAMLFRGNSGGNRASRRVATTVNSNLGSELREIERLQKSKLPLYKWFHQNKFVMDGVYAKFKELEARIDNISQHSADDYVTQWKYDHDLDISKLSLFRKKRLSDWVRCALNDNEHEIRKLERGHASNSNTQDELRNHRDAVQKRMDQEHVQSYEKDLLTDKVRKRHGP